MPSFEENMKNRKAVLQDVASWSDPGFKPPTNVTGNPPPKGVANMAANQAEQAANNALKQMGQ